jgi:hypothetical protein
MDMRTRLGPWLTGTALHALGGSYRGTIASVIEQEIFNRWTRQRTRELVIVFTDGKKVVLNRGMQLELIDRFGYESDNWIGCPIELISQPVERVDRRTGEAHVSWQKLLAPPGAAADSEQPPECLSGVDDDPDLSDPIGAHDEDEAVAAPQPFRQRRA